MEVFGSKLRYYRKLRRLTQAELSRQVGVAPAYISQIESGLRIPSLPVARRFARVLSVDIEVLLGDSRKPDLADDTLSHSEKLELLRQLTMAVESEIDEGTRELDPETYPGSTVRRLHSTEATAVRAYTFRATTPEEQADFRSHDGNEEIYCAVGTLQVKVDEEVLHLSQGETAQFDAPRAHAVTGSPGSVAISTVSPPVTRENLRVRMDVRGSDTDRRASVKARS
ncbi:MAG: XRE family transcriptional regulator [Gemmatimonadota bacterium]|jgi:transcriptional regulator with XRE-family HTH domain|nr:XRE family transcriptional regulator [Gemmatimonadota bacterium]MDP6801833.1 XRE family transcriptional regulator [Gemmatimonadota bacterium]MDP7031559.1 XRE family transcriptional regulator [Gemmatimonadota bacterium]